MKKIFLITFLVGLSFFLFANSFKQTSIIETNHDTYDYLKLDQISSGLRGTYYQVLSNDTSYNIFKPKNLNMESNSFKYLNYLINQFENDGWIVCAFNDDIELDYQVVMRRKQSK